MAKCNLSFDFDGSAEALIARVRKAVEEAGGSFSGDASSGSFSVPPPIGKKIEGTYTISGQKLDIAINKKPGFVSCKRIKKLLNTYLEETEAPVADAGE